MGAVVVLGASALVAVSTYPRIRFAAPSGAVAFVALWAAAILFWGTARVVIPRLALCGAALFTFYAAELGQVDHGEAGWAAFLLTLGVARIVWTDPFGKASRRAAAAGLLAGAAAPACLGGPALGVGWIAHAWLARRWRRRQGRAGVLAAALVSTTAAGLLLAAILRPGPLFEPPAGPAALGRWLIEGLVAPSRALWVWAAALGIGGWLLNGSRRAWETGRPLASALVRSDLGGRSRLMLAAWTIAAVAGCLASAEPWVGGRVALLPPAMLWFLLDAQAVLRWPRGRCGAAWWLSRAVLLLAAAAAAWFLVRRGATGCA
jgi:hypothetical protein